MHSYEFPPLGGGGAKVVYGLSTQLVKMGHHIDLITMKFGELKKFEDVKGIQVHRVPCIRTRQSICYTPEMLSYVIAAIPTALRLVKRRDYHLLHTHFIFPDGLISYFVRKMTGIPYLITVHGSDVPGYNPDRFTHQHKLLLPLWRQIVHLASLTVSPSKNLETLIRAQDSSTPITVIPNGIEVDKFVASREKKNCILLVCRMFPRKGVQYFLQSLKTLDPKLEYEVNILGDGPFLPTLRQKASNLNVEVKFWGALDNTSPELRNLYETSSIFMLPSESENFPMVLLEAMAAGLAIITSHST